MPDKLRWGVLGAAKIARTKVIPAMQKAANAEIVAIASRDLAKARTTAAELSIPQAYGSYEELLTDSGIDAIYNPLPNHLHVPWTIRAAEAGKHVLCEKPIALNVDEVHHLIATRDRTGVRIGEAFMVRSHPQWLRAREIARSGELGELRAIQGFFSYFNRDPENVRNVASWGGGGIMDIGCYPITMSRFILESEPHRVCTLMDVDPDFGTDRLASVLLDFPGAQASFTSSTQLVSYQRMNIFGTKGRVELLIPWNTPPDRPSRIIIDIGGDFLGTGQRIEEFPAVDQYTLQAERFGAAVTANTPLPVELEESLRNMSVIQAVIRSGHSKGWESV